MQSQPNSYANCQFANDYKIHFLLGEGGQASVYLASKGKNLYAVKIYSEGFGKQEAFKREVHFLQNLKYKYLINIVDSDQNAQVKLKSSKVEKRTIIVLDYAEAELYDFIAKQGRFSPEVCRTLFRQLIDAIYFLDSKGITHRDLKPENILFDQDFNFKVSDFGLSTFSQGHNKDGNLYSRVGTEGYKPPEMQQGKYTGIQCDLFAAGVLLFIMYNGTPPFMSTKPHDKIYKLIKDQNYAKFWSLHEKKKPLGFYPDSLKRLLNEFFSYDPSKRPTFASLSQNQWLGGDSLMGMELKEYMQERYDKIAKDDEIKKKVAQIRKRLLQESLQEQQKNSCNEKQSRGQNINVFIERYNDFNTLKLQYFPTTQRKLLYVNQNLGFVLAYLNDYLDECYNEKTTFMQDFLQQIKPVEFSMQVEGDKILMKFVFEIDEEDEESLKITGNVYQLNGKQVGIQWVKETGNDFWLNSIITTLNQALQALV